MTLHFGFALAACALLAACATPAAAPVASGVCRTPMPLELRLARMEARLARAYAEGPALTREEAATMNRLQACYATGGDCSAERDVADTSGLAERDRIRSAEFDIADLVRRAAGMRLGAERANLLVVAMLSAQEAEDALAAFLGAQQRHGDGVSQLMLVSADLHQAIVCDAADLEAGRRVGAPYDASAPVPEGP